ncbi:MAG: hypothetical protein IPM69_03725 [Ignavibacteria bacterium]|nr:hypothetical protein [Ignavibacteria bacterium]
MDWLSIAGAAIMGGIGGAVGGYAGRKVIRPERNNAKGIRQFISGGVTLLFICLWIFVVKPIVITHVDERSEVENAIIDTEARPIFLAIKKYDGVTFNRLIDELIIITKEKNSTSQEIYAKSQKLGQAATLKYYSNASPKDILSYVKKYIVFLEAKYETMPLIICKLENPEVYGMPDRSMSQEMEKFGLFNYFETIIKNSVEHPTGYNKDSAEIAFNTYIEEYSITYPEHVQTLSMTTGLTKPENVKKFALVYLDLYRELVKLSPEKCSIVYKHMRNML